MQDIEKSELTYTSLLQRKFTFYILAYFWILNGSFLLSHGVIEYFLVEEVWRHVDIARFSYDFFMGNVVSAVLIGIIVSIAICLTLDHTERLIYELKLRVDKITDSDKESLLACLYYKQKKLPYMFLIFVLLYSIVNTTRWPNEAFLTSGPHLWIAINTFLFNFSLGFVVYRLFNLAIVRSIGDLVKKFSISLMGNRKPLNMNYELLIASVCLGIFCIILSVYIDALANFEDNMVINFFFNITEIFNTKGIPIDNFRVANIMKRELSQQAILIIGTDPYIGLNENEFLLLFRVNAKIIQDFHIAIVYILLCAMIYLHRSVYLINRMIGYLSGYLRNILQGLTSLKNEVPLLRFDALGYMTGYLNLLFQYIYKIIMNLVKSIVALSNTSEDSIVDAASGTNEVYSIIHSFASINLKADLQLHSIRGIGKALNDLLEIIKSINNEVQMQEQQLKKARNIVNGVKSAIVSMEQSSKNVAKLFEKLNISADSGLGIVQKADSVMSEISQTSYGIRDIVGSIEKISGQTGLLAMSASIESAHAGNHGLGFSVVAQSVRNLSDDSGVQSKAIHNQIEEMIQKVEIGVLLSRHVNRSFQSIASSTQTSANFFHQIYNSIEEQNKQSTTISSDIEELLATAEEILDFTKEQVEVLSQLSEATVTFEKNIKTISESSQRQSDMSEELISVFENFNNQVALNIERVYSINEKINRFKLD